jgi:hypothetical protein
MRVANRVRMVSRDARFLSRLARVAAIVAISGGAPDAGVGRIDDAIDEELVQD